MNKVFSAITVICFFIVAVFLVSLFTGFTVATLWGWFLVPIGVANIGYANAYGLSLLVSVLMSTRGIDLEDTSWKPAAFGIILNLFALLFGYITVTNFM